MISKVRRYYSKRWEQWLDRRLPRVHRTTLGQRRIFIFPSPPGIGFLLLLVVMLLMGINYQNNLIFGFCFLLFSLFLVTIFSTYANLSGLTLVAGPVAPVFAGDEACFHLRLHAGNRTREGLHLAWPEHFATDASADRGAEQVVKLYLPAPVRGQFQPPRLLLKTYYPLGVMRAWTWLRIDWNCLVYPRPEAAPLPPAAADLDGDRSSGQRVSGEDFAGFRDYREGDSLRHVYWRSWAKGQTLQVKDFETPVSADLWLEWDGLGGLPVERRLSILCHHALEANRQGRAFGLRIPGETIAVGSGEQHLDMVLRALALYGQ